MNLKETNWDAAGGAAEYLVPYPDAPIADFVDWIRKTSAWLENPELVHRRVRRLNGVLSDWRDAPRPEGPLMETSSADGVDWQAKYEAVAGELQAIHAKAADAKANRLAALERAQAAKKAKRDKREAKARASQV